LCVRGGTARKVADYCSDAVMARTAVSAAQVLGTKFLSGAPTCSNWDSRFRLRVEIMSRFGKKRNSRSHKQTFQLFRESKHLKKARRMFPCHRSR
jgi:hypothetical protein